ncbi:DUF2062 domain-containing protein [Halovenus rubra]|uniref:DUF2062 domain-containing protein n=2 Tax=Halovenus rubra TaxID=869890 RepID=A0ACC7DYJ5_9EURY|nr:DUF2062 domain-containing protein [Halovenus rubra]
MSASRVTGYVEGVQTTLRGAFSEDRSPHAVASSFAFGMFAIALPNFGAAVLALMWIGKKVAWTSNLAFVAAVAILNPVVKGGIYSLSFVIGVTLLGPVPEMTTLELSLDTGRDVLIRLVLGNLLLAFGIAIVSYAVSYRTVQMVRKHR